MSVPPDKIRLLERKEKLMTEKLELALRLIANCHLCNGKGHHYWGNGEDYFDAEACECNIYEIILDHDGDVIYDNGLITEPELSIFATAEAN